MGKGAAVACRKDLELNLSLLEGLEPMAHTRFAALLLCWGWLGFGRVEVLEGKRTTERQQHLYGLGRSEQECKLAGVPASCAQPTASEVTWCKPEDSKHVKGLAVDIYWGHYTAYQFRRGLEVARQLGFKLGADWKVRDWYHFEVGGED